MSVSFLHDELKEVSTHKKEFLEQIELSSKEKSSAVIKTAGILSDAFILRHCRAKTILLKFVEKSDTIEPWTNK